MPQPQLNAQNYIRENSFFLAKVICRRNKSQKLLILQQIGRWSLGSRGDHGQI
jgi:hypothetical protein